MITKTEEENLMENKQMPDDFTMESGRNNDGKQLSLKERREALNKAYKENARTRRESELS